MASFLAVKNGFILAFERKGGGFRMVTAVIIRLIEPEDVLQIRVRSLLYRRIIPIVSFSLTQELFYPGKCIKKRNANLGFEGND
jgi:hypothetical protein